MVAATNPYRPGTAADPPYLAGRGTLREQIEINVSSHGNNFGSFLVIHGTRGLGKTCLLSHMSARAREEGWDVIGIEAARDEPFLKPFLHQLRELKGLPKRLGGSIRSLLERTDLEVDLKVASARRPAKERRPVRDEFLATVLEVIEHRSDRAGGVLLTVDEAQVIARAELAPLGTLVQTISRNPALTASVALAGLPSLRDQVHKAFTYSERWLFSELGHLSELESRAALAVPARDAGRPFTAAALDVAAPATKGYPFGVQLMGFYAWSIAIGDEITVDDAAEATRRMHEALSGEIHRRRWETAPGYARGYLAAAARLGALTGHADTGEIAALLGTDHKSLSAARAVLIDAGTLIATARGRIEEGIPGLFDYVNARPDAATAIAERRDPGSSEP